MNSRLSTGCVLMILLVLLLSGCSAGQRSYSSGIEAMQEQNYDLAVAELSQALQADPGNVEFQARLAAARGRAAWYHLEKKGDPCGQPGNMLKRPASFVSPLY